MIDMIEMGLRWIFWALGLAGMAAVVGFDWVAPDRLVAATAFASLMLVGSLGIRVIYNERKAASATHLQAAE